METNIGTSEKVVYVKCRNCSALTYWPWRSPRTLRRWRWSRTPPASRPFWCWWGGSRGRTGHSCSRRGLPGTWGWTRACWHLPDPSPPWASSPLLWSDPPCYTTLIHDTLYTIHCAVSVPRDVSLRRHCDEGNGPACHLSESTLALEDAGRAGCSTGVSGRHLRQREY